MARTTPTVRQDTLTWHEGEHVVSLVVETPAWFAWLEQATTFSFKAEHGGGFTARKERFQRGGCYWKAYRKCGGKLRTAYLGKSAELSLTRLRQVKGLLVSSSTPAPIEDELFLVTRLAAPYAHSSLVPRPRLQQKLDQGLKCALILVSASAGYGKTTLLSQWLLHHRRAAWLSIDQHDNDPLRFWSYVLAALERLSPGVSGAAWPLMQSLQPPPIETMLTLLINQLTKFPEETLLVIDDYHLIEEPLIHTTVTFFLDHLPAHIHLVLSSRVDPPLPLARLRACGKLTEIRTSDLSFTLPEANAFLIRSMQLPLSSEEVASIATQMEGWIAGMQLVAISLQAPDGLPSSPMAFAKEDRYVVDYLFEEVFKRQTTSVQAFLLKTSVLESLSGPLCDEVMGERGSQEMLELLERTNLFLLTLDNCRQWYRYHPFFATFLQKLLKQRYPELSLELHCRAGRWYEQRGQIEEAVAQGLAGQNWGHVASLLEPISSRMIARGQHVTLKRWLEQLPGEALGKHPHLFVNYAYTLLHVGRLDACAALLEPLEAACRGRDEQALLGELFVLRTALAQSEGEASVILELARQAHSRLKHGDIHQRIIVTLAQGTAYALAGQVSQAYQCFHTACSQSKASDDHIGTLQACRLLGSVEVMKGNLHGAASIYRDAIRLASEPPLWMEADAHLQLAGVYYAWNELEKAVCHIRRCMELSQQSSSGRYCSYASLLLARVLAARGEMQQALRMLEIASEQAPGVGRQVIGRLVEIGRVRLWLRQGRIMDAAEWAYTKGGITDKPLYERLCEYFMLVRVSITRYKSQQALQLLRSLQRLLEQGEGVGDMVEFLVLKALAHAVQGEVAQALDALERSLLLAEPGGYVRVFLDEGAPMLALLRLAASHNRQTPYRQGLLEAAEMELSTHPHFPQAPRLSSREQQILRLLAEGASNQDVAQKLVIAENTVKKHVSNIYARIGVASRTQAVAWARQEGLL